MRTARRADLPGQGLRVLVAGLCLLAAQACSSPAPVSVTLHLPEQAQFSLDEVSFRPTGHVLSVRLERTGLLQLRTDGTPIEVRIPELCAVAIPRLPAPQSQIDLHAKPLLATTPLLAQVGYAAEFSIEVTPGCPEAASGTIRWHQEEGLALTELTASERGHRLRGRTLPLSAYFPEGLPDGVVPISARTQGRYVLKAIPTGQRVPVRPFTVTLSSIARATGLPSVAVSQRLLLGGTGWRATRLAPGSRARVEEHAGASSFQPDVPGRFELIAATGQRLELQALTHDLTPLDCGRAECHAAIARAAVQSPMSHAFELPFVHDRAAPTQQACMLACHVVGEPGLRDGGYLALAAALHYQPSAHVPFRELPHALQRLAGVRCTSCHGPGAVPPHAGRVRILRSAVCATCHDAPPTYPHVAQWSSSRMARADARPETRAPGCAQCHTTLGFLLHNQLRSQPSSAEAEDAPSMEGIGCAACHAPHGEHIGRALVRKLAQPARLPPRQELADTSSAVCAACHSPLADELVPTASSAALWLGQLDLPESLGGDVLSAAAPHTKLPGGCIGCHGKQAAQPSKTDHAFRVDRALCAECHTGAKRARWEQAKQALAARTRALERVVAQGCGLERAASAASPPHAQPERRACRTPALARARYLLGLVLEDSAAYEHNAPFAAALLDQVAAALHERSAESPRSPGSERSSSLP